jgi:pimeloyl-ACP methyl ester carboxylesterase
MIRHALYLHGFASSPQSTKATVLEEHFRRVGVKLLTPDFNEPDFFTLTVTRMLDQTDHEIAALPPGPVALIGSSLGGFVAVHTASRQSVNTSHPVEALVLLAPAFDFGRNRMRDLGPGGLDEWKKTGRLEVFHYAFGGVRPVNYALYEDAQRYDAYQVKLGAPTVIVYGKRDESVDPASVERWAEGRANVALRSVEDGHQLTNSLDVVWQETAKLMGLTP